jgi:hypothetical protein
MAVLPGVLECQPLRRTVQVRLGPNTLRLPGGKPIFAVSRQQFMKYPGYYLGIERRDPKKPHLPFGPCPSHTLRDLQPCDDWSQSSLSREYHKLWFVRPLGGWSSFILSPDN